VRVTLTNLSVSEGIRNRNLGACCLGEGTNKQTTLCTSDRMLNLCGIDMFC
jgi:hypothetical protein